LQAVTRVKLEQASKVKMWMPTRLETGEGRADGEETRRGNAPGCNQQAPDPVHRGSEHSMQGRWSGLVGEARGWRRSRLQTSPERATASLGVGEGHTTEEAG